MVGEIGGRPAIYGWRLTIGWVGTGLSVLALVVSARTDLRGQERIPEVRTGLPGEVVREDQWIEASAVAERCLDVWPAPTPAEGHRVRSARCEVMDSGDLIRTRTTEWTWALYRHVVVYEADADATPRQREFLPDTSSHDQLVLFATPTSRRLAAEHPKQVRPVWRDRSDVNLEFIRAPRAGRLPTTGDGAVMAHRRCFNGTGGCRDYPYLLRADGSIRPLEPGYTLSLRDRLPEGWTIRKGIWLDPEHLVIEAPIHVPMDPNAAPSFRATASLRFEGDALVLGSLDLRPEEGGMGWGVDPEERRFGYIRSGMSEEALEEAYGPETVARSDLYLGEGICTPGTVLYPGEPWQAEVAWADSARMRPAFARARGTTGPWRTPLGVTLGTTVAQLAEFAGEPVKFGGFGWDYGGGLVWTYEGGALSLRVAPDSVSNRRLAALRGDPRAEALFGDRDVRSDEPLVDELTIEVVEMSLRWADPSIEGSCD